jgi:hypothetical protein
MTPGRQRGSRCYAIQKIPMEVVKPAAVTHSQTKEFELDPQG